MINEDKEDEKEDNNIINDDQKFKKEILYDKELNEDKENEQKY